VHPAHGLGDLLHLFVVEVREDRQRQDAARHRVGHRQPTVIEVCVGALAVHRRVEVLAGIDAFGEERECEAVTVEAELIGVDRDRQVLERARIA
jgi:hypothetical protein